MSNELSTEGLYDPLAAFVTDRVSEFDLVPEEHREELERLARSLSRRLEVERTVALTFICTHNSRRSHFAQIWARTAAHIYGVAGVETFSGGTEATAFNPRAVAAIRRSGFEVEKEPGTKNPVYRVSLGDGLSEMECFSKLYDQPPNPNRDFIAVMTCSAADAGCPVVLGAVERIAIPYDDPKAADGTEREARIYDERCREIAREMLFFISSTGSF